MVGLRTDFVVKQEVIMYADDSSILWYEDSEGDKSFRGIKIGDEIYWFIRYATSLGDAKYQIKRQVSFSKFSTKDVRTIFGHLDIRILGSQWKVVLICNYCGGSAVGEAKISLRKITIYGRPPIGAKDMKIKVNCDWYESPYIYNIISQSAYCGKCGLTE